MHPRAVCNFVYVYLKPGRDATEEDREKYDAELYAPIGGYREALRLVDQIGG